MRFLLTLFIIALMQFSATAQVSEDSVLIARSRDAFFLTSSSPDSAYHIAENVLKISIPAGKKRVSAFAYKTKGWALLRLGNFDSSLSYLLESVHLFKELNDSLETMMMYANLASAYSANSQFTESISYLLKADTLAKKLNNIRTRAELQKQMGILYREQGAYTNAIPYFNEGIKLYREANDTVHELEVMMSLSINYNMMSSPDSSMALLSGYKKVIHQLRGHTYQKAMFQERLGDTYLGLKKYNDALTAYKNAYTIFENGDNHADAAYEAMNVGRTYMQLKDYTNAEHYLLKAYKINDSLQLLNYSQDAADQLAILYQNTLQWQKAYQWLDKARKMDDSLHLNQQNEKIAELQTKYETAKKDNEINLLKKGKELDQLKLEKQKVFRYSAIIVLILLVLFGTLAIYRYRTVQRVRRQVEMEKLRNDIARDLHDDIGSALSSIKVMSKVALQGSSGKTEMVKNNLEKIHENSNNILDSMSDIVWAINPINDSFEKTIFRMKEFAADILEPQDIQYEFRLTENLHSTSMNLKERKDFFLFFKEAINNAAKYSRSTIVTIDLYRQDGFLILKVADNGIGFDTGKNSSGNGLRNMNQRAKELNGEFSISSEPNKGTTIELKIKPKDRTSNIT